MASEASASRAYVLYGVAGCGKTTLGRALVERLNDAAPETGRDAVFVGAGLAALPDLPALAAEPLKASFYDYTVSQYGEPFDLGAFRGNVTVVLNVASE